MSNQINYVRRFIIFKDEYGNMKDSKAKGHGKLELKGNNLTFSLDIKGAEANNFYDIKLIKKRESFILGKIYTQEDKSGKREIDINYRDLEKNGFILDEIDGIVLVRDNNILLGETLKKDDRYLKMFIEEVEKSEEPIQLEETQELEAQAEEVEKTVELETEEVEVEVEAEEIEAEEIDKIYKTPAIDQSPPIKEGQSTEENMFLEQSYREIMEEIFNIPELGYVSPLEEEEAIKNNIQTEELNEYIYNILNFFPQSQPLNIILDNYQWWKIDLEMEGNDKSFLPYYSYIIGGDTKGDRFEEGINPKELLKKYNHYIFGLYSEKERIKYYVYGIPGEFSKAEHPKSGKTGFNTWFEGTQAPGYWLIYVEAKTGKILYPINPMVAKR